MPEPLQQSIVHIAAHVLLKTFVFVAIGVARDCCCIAKVPRAPPIDEWRKQRTSCVCGVACPARRGTTPKKNDEIGQLFDQKGPLFSLLFWFSSSRKKMGTTLPLACIANCCYLCCCCGCLTFFRQFSWWWENLPTKVPHTHTFITGRTFVWNGSFVSKK